MNTPILFFVARMQVLAHIRRMSTTVDLMIQKLVQNAWNPNPKIWTSFMNPTICRSQQIRPDQQTERKCSDKIFNRNCFLPKQINPKIHHRIQTRMLNQILFGHAQSCSHPAKRPEVLATICFKISVGIVVVVVVVAAPAGGRRTVTQHPFQIQFGLIYPVIHGLQTESHKPNQRNDCAHNVDQCRHTYISQRRHWQTPGPSSSTP